MHKYFLIFLALISSVFAADSSLTPELVASFQQKIQQDKNINAMVNAISYNNPQDLMKNRQADYVDDFFAVKVKTQGITDQQSSGRCWLFTSYNVLRYKVINQLNLADFEFSTNYGYFYDQLEKANLFLQAIIATGKQPMDDKHVDWLFHNPIGDGGVWNNAVAITEKYGVVPMYAMPESYNSNNTRNMRAVLALKLREDGLQLRNMMAEKTAAKKIEQAKNDMLSDIYRILVLHLGQPPTEFVWRYQDKDGKVSEPVKMTPQQFYHDVVGVDMKEYVMLMNDPTHDYYKAFEIEWDRAVWEAPNWTYVNLPVDELKQLAKKSLLANESMYFSCDVGKQLDRKDGVLDLDNYDYEALYGVKFGMDKKQRIQTFASASSHGMNLVGVDTTQTGEISKWLLENSWGSSAGRKGFLVMTDAWFNEYMFRLVVKKEFVPEKILQIYTAKPEKLLPWDPMYVPLDN